jgi:hypothetical protein
MDGLAGILCSLRGVVSEKLDFRVERKRDNSFSRSTMRHLMGGNQTDSTAKPSFSIKSLAREHSHWQHSWLLFWREVPLGFKQQNGFAN